MATANAHTANSKNGSAPAAQNAAEIEEQFEALRSDISALASSVAALGTRKAGDLKQKATETSGAAARRVKEDLGRIEAGVSTGVRAHPIRAIAIAAGLGLAIGYLVRK